MSGWIGITMGDPAGVGPEIVLKALQTLAAESPSVPRRFLLLGNPRIWQSQNQRLTHPLPLPLEAVAPDQATGPLAMLDTSGIPLLPKVEPYSPEAAHAAIHWLQDGAAGCLNRQLDALVTGPVNKESILRAHIPFVGQTELLSELAGTRSTIMMLLGHDDRNRWLRVALATTHLPLRQVADALQTDRIQLAIELAADACLRLGLDQARIGVCGLNPHAGEGGKLGREEIDIITPAIQAATRQHLQVTGPLAADALFHQAFRGDFDAVVAMYHDQGLAPLKMIGFDTGINWTLGLPFVRTSPDHGTAYGIAGRDIANPASMLAAIRLAIDLSHQR